MTGGPPLRIGVFSATLPTPDRKPGGVDVMIHRIADALARRGQDVTVISYDPKPAGAAYRHELLAPAHLAHRRATRMLVLPWLWHRAGASRFDVVHLNGDDWFWFPRRVPTVRTFHGSALQEARTATSLKRRLSQYLVFAFELLASRLATTSFASGAGHGCEVYGVRGALTCGVDVAAGRPADRARRSAAPAILFVGTWEGRKRGSLLADAFARDVRPQFPDAQLWMVSDRAEERPGVQWFDRPDDGQVRDLYDRATVFCLPSSYEGLGIPYIEAMAAGVPVVTTPNPGAAFVLENGSAGRIVDDRDLGRALTALLGDAEQRAALVAAGHARAEHFSWDAVCAAHLTAYREAIARGRASGRNRRPRDVA
jgi:glycosyltransferase involved in cell wall biosynthesis